MPKSSSISMSMRSIFLSSSSMVPLAFADFSCPISRAVLAYSTLKPFLACLVSQGGSQIALSGSRTSGNKQVLMLFYEPQLCKPEYLVPAHTPLYGEVYFLHVRLVTEAADLMARSTAPLRRSSHSLLTSHETNWSMVMLSIRKFQDSF